MNKFETCIDCGQEVIYDDTRGWLHIEKQEDCNPCFLEDQRNWN
tara:strand:+ start:823 stop:954 length:132 start_codon:yes stop_codon:yes gene_type:complete